MEMIGLNEVLDPQKARENFGYDSMFTNATNFTLTNM